MNVHIIKFFIDEIKSGSHETPMMCVRFNFKNYTYFELMVGPGSINLWNLILGNPYMFFIFYLLINLSELQVFPYYFPQSWLPSCNPSFGRAMDPAVEKQLVV